MSAFQVKTLLFQQSANANGSVQVDAPFPYRTTFYINAANGVSTVNATLKIYALNPQGGGVGHLISTTTLSAAGPVAPVTFDGIAGGFIATISAYVDGVITVSALAMYP